MLHLTLNVLNCLWVWARVKQMDSGFKSKFLRGTEAFRKISSMGAYIKTDIVHVIEFIKIYTPLNPYKGHFKSWKSCIIIMKTF